MYSNTLHTSHNGEVPPKPPSSVPMTPVDGVEVPSTSFSTQYTREVHSLVSCRIFDAMLEVMEPHKYC